MPVPLTVPLGVPVLLLLAERLWQTVLLGLAPEVRLAMGLALRVELALRVTRESTAHRWKQRVHSDCSE